MQKTINNSFYGTYLPLRYILGTVGLVKIKIILIVNFLKINTVD